VKLGPRRRRRRPRDREILLARPRVDREQQLALGDVRAFIDLDRLERAFESRVELGVPQRFDLRDVLAADDDVFHDRRRDRKRSLGLGCLRRGFLTPTPSETQDETKQREAAHIALRRAHPARVHGFLTEITSSRNRSGFRREHRRA